MKKEELKDFCKSIGIDCVGIAGVGPYYDLEKIIKQRLFNGYITGMEESIIEKRVNPKETMENVKSIIVCAFPYYIGNFNESNLSKYCYGEDYHIVVKDMLQQICNHLSDNIDNFDYKIFADNGPLVDRYLAYLSGIGYFGINNNIITDEYGSYVFIGYILTNYEFQSDTPLEKTCIKCGKCVKYCPGNALLGNYEMKPKTFLFSFNNLPTARLNAFLLSLNSRMMVSGLALSLNGSTPSNSSMTFNTSSASSSICM